jgi:hypothetical protein
LFAKLALTIPVCLSNVRRSLMAAYIRTKV